MRNYFRYILEKYLHAGCSEASRRIVQGWLLDKKHADEKQEALNKLWQKAEEMPNPVNLQESVYRFHRNLNRTVRYKNRLLRWQIAAVFLSAMSIFSLYRLMNNEECLPEMKITHAPKAEIMEVRLPDGTQAVLNAGSSLFYPERFTNKHRKVYLLGEACFNVAEDKEHPFIVSSGNFQVTALGTRFNVNAYTFNTKISATLIEGSIKVDIDLPDTCIILKPEQQLIYDKTTQKYSVLYSQIDDVTAWQRGELLLENMTLPEVLEVLEHRFKCSFIYSEKTAELKTYNFRFRQDTCLEEVLEIISQVVGNMQYKFKENKCYLKCN